jgi:RND family efflux transporter MFP subunit
MRTNGLKKVLTGLCVGAWLLPVAADAEQSSEFDCLIEPHMVIELSSRVDGIIKKMGVDRGDQIEPGQVIAKLESSAEQAALEYARARARMIAEVEQHKANLLYGQRNESRIAELHQKQAVSSSEIDRVRTEARIAQFKLAQAEENKRLAELDLQRAVETLNRHTIRSPIKGVVVDRYLNPGESVEDKAIVKLAQIDPLRVEVVAPISQFGQIKHGQAALVYPEVAIGGEYESTVTIVDPVMDAASGTFRVRLTLPNPEHQLTSGLKRTVRFLDQPPPVTADSETLDAPVQNTRKLAVTP